MTASKPLTAGIEAPDAEVELSAQDLLELSGPCDDNKRAPEPVARTKVVSVEPSAPALGRRATPAATRRDASLWRVAVSLPFAVAAIGALYFFTGSNDDTAAPSVAASQSHLPASTSKGEGKPVVFANPFDAKEVFEFPAGTTEAEARDAVAEILMERAMKRQQQFDARVSNNR